MYRYGLTAIFLATSVFSPIIAQQPGSLDFTFGDQGKQIVSLGTGNAFGRSMAIQPDGKMIMACIAHNGTSNDFTLIRLKPDGQPDHEFGDQGRVMTDFNSKSDIPESIALDEFNRVVVAGYSETNTGFDFAVARYLPDGILDESFGGDGLVTTTLGITAFCKAVAVQPDNKIILGGYVFNTITAMNEFVLVRYRTDGIIDSTFDGDGIVMTNLGIGSGVANAMLLQPDGKIVLAGQAFNELGFNWEIAIARYNEDGTPDENWGEHGMVLTATPGVNHTINAVAIQGDNKIVVGGYNGTAPSNNVFTVARYQPDGEPDQSFGTNGVLIDSYGAQDNQVNTLVIQPDGQILIAGTTLIGNADQIAIARITEQGAFDDTFGDQGVVVDLFGQNDGIKTMVLQQDGKLIVGGESFDGHRFSIVAARYETGLSTAVNQPGSASTLVSVYPNPAIGSITIAYQLQQSSTVQIGLFSTDGRLMHVLSSQQEGIGEHIERYALPQSLQGGMYWIALNIENGSVSKRVVVVR